MSDERAGGPWWRLVRWLAWAAIRVYYRSFDVKGDHQVPAEGPVLVVVNHPNSILDAAALLLAIDRPVRFGAKAPLFRSKILGTVLRRIGGIPIHRRGDAGSDPESNQATYAQYIAALHRGEVCAIFPEGFTHLDPELKYVKAGAGRIAKAAVTEFDGDLNLVVLPVGLTFRPEQVFRGDAFVRIGAPFAIDDLRDAPREEAIPELQTRMTEALRPLILHLESTDHRPLVQGVAKVMHDDLRTTGAIDPLPAIADAERMAGRCLNHFLETDPDLVGRVRRRYEAYRRLSDTLRVPATALRMRDRPIRWLLAMLGTTLLLVLGLPVFAVGMLTAYAPGRLTDVLAQRVAKREGSDAALVVARIVIGAVVFGVFWGLLLWLIYDWSASLPATGAAGLVLAASGIYTARFRTRAQGWIHRGLSLSPAFVRRGAVRRVAEERERLLWILNESLLRYETETGESSLPTDAARRREQERRSRKKFVRRQLAVVALACVGLWLLPGRGDTELSRLADTESPWMSLAESDASAAVRQDAGRLAGYLAQLSHAEKRSNRLRREFREGDRTYYDSDDDAAVRDALLEFLSARDGLMRIAWFYRDALNAPEDLRAPAFVLAHTATVEAVARGMQLVETFGDDSEARRKLNERDRTRGIPSGVFDSVRANLADVQALETLSEGVAHFERMRQGDALPTGEPWDGLILAAARGADVVEDLSERVAQYRFDASVRHAVQRGDTVRYDVSAVVSTWVGDARVKTTPGGHGQITAEQVEWVRGQLQPGDIVLERRNWYLSNAFLPGFWPHATLYVGGEAGVEALGIADDPRVVPRLDDMRREDPHGGASVIIEAISDGVVFTSLEYSVGGADAICVFRPRLPPEQIAEAVARAIGHHGKPYDFDFDFFSTDKLVCTEVVYQAYDPVLHLELEEIAGRKTLPALAFVRRWKDDVDRGKPSLDLILFIDHDETTGVARIADAETLVESLDRPGLALLQARRGVPGFLTPVTIGLVAFMIVGLTLLRRR